MTTPATQPLTCDVVDEHADMYPEFAPEPISVECTNPATHIATYVDHMTGGEPETISEHVCAEHAAKFERMMSDPEPHPWMSDFQLVALSDVEHHVLAQIEGVGCSYTIVADEMFERFDVHVSSGPVRTLVATFRDFVTAARHVVDEIERDLVESTS
jgi:hypothetical protein